VRGDHTLKTGIVEQNIDSSECVDSGLDVAGDVWVDRHISGNSDRRSSSLLDELHGRLQVAVGKVNSHN